MIKQRNHQLPDFPVETWNEELFRAQKFTEATQKRKAQKLVAKELDRLKKKAAIGRLRIEP
ncbi:MAG TPA: hypothetical protein VMR70_17475 [Flavisolibacter sp.]|nr:hypothetical protein [Flavisolibacter sp.]